MPDFPEEELLEVIDSLSADFPLSAAPPPPPPPEPKTFLPASYKPPWDFSEPNRDGVYSEPHSKERRKLILWRKPEPKERGVGKPANLTRMGLLTTGMVGLRAEAMSCKACTP